MQYKRSRISNLFLGLMVLVLTAWLFTPEVYAFSEAIVQKASSLQTNLIRVAQACISIGLIGIIFSFITGRWHWKWIGCLFVAGVLTGSFSIFNQYILAR